MFSGEGKKGRRKNLLRGNSEVLCFAEKRSLKTGVKRILKVREKKGKGKQKREK